MPLFEHFDYGAPDNLSSSNSLDRGDEGRAANKTHLYGTENCGESGDINPFFSDLEVYHENTMEGGLLLSKYQQEQVIQSFSNFGYIDDLYFDVVSPPFQSCPEEIIASMASGTSDSIESRKKKTYALPLASFRILKNYGSRFRRLKDEKVNVPDLNTAPTKVSGRKLSTEATLRLAGEKFMQSCSQQVDDFSSLSHPFRASFLGLSSAETRDVELVQYLLAAAEKADLQHFDRANKLLGQCDAMSSNSGSPVQRLVYYFCQALREKINRETGRTMQNGLGKKQLLDVKEALSNPCPANIAFHQEVPFSQVSLFTGIQAIVENAADAKKVHVIDLDITNGIHCIVLMQALVDRSEPPLEHLKVTAIRTQSEAQIEETGKRLMSFAQSMNLPFSFHVVMVEDMLHLHKNLFELDDEEVVAVYSSYLLLTMIAQPEELECLMRAIRNFNPCVMVVVEVEANHNSPIFVNRFIETLFFYGAFFDALEDCMDHSTSNMKTLESVFFSRAISNIVAAEGKERTIRHVSINVWRAFFARFGMAEIELSKASLYQASLLVNTFPCGNSCTLDMDGKCLLVGWKGTPLHSVSTWKFLKQDMMKSVESGS